MSFTDEIFVDILSDFWAKLEYVILFQMTSSFKITKHLTLFTNKTLKKIKLYTPFT